MVLQKGEEEKKKEEKKESIGSMGEIWLYIIRYVRRASWQVEIMFHLVEYKNKNKNNQ